MFREVNERIRDAADRFGTDGHLYEFLCECGVAACADRVHLTRAEYEAVRKQPRRFVLAHGHSIPAIEAVVDAQADHEVVEKHGAAGEVAAALDSRAA